MHATWRYHRCCRWPRVCHSCELLPLLFPEWAGGGRGRRANDGKGGLRGSDRLSRCELKVETVGLSDARERVLAPPHNGDGSAREEGTRSQGTRLQPATLVAVPMSHMPSPPAHGVVQSACPESARCECGRCGCAVFDVRRLIVVLNCDPLPSTLHAVRYLKPSSPFVVFSQYLEVPGLGVWCGLHVAVLEWRWLVAPFPLCGKFCAGVAAAGAVPLHDLNACWAAV